MNDAITIQDVTKRYGAQVAVDSLSLSVPKGSLYGFIGPNGSGKTTTLRMIMNILLPDSGRISVLGHEDTRAARDRVSYLPEERGLYKKMTVRRLLRYYGELKGLKQPGLDASIGSWIEKLDLSKWLDKKIDALSKGMAQKVQFIASVIGDPELLILDEPFTGLDPVNRETMKDAILELRKSGTTIIFSTHDMSVAESLCDRIFMIFKGKKILDGTLGEIQDDYGSDTIRIRTLDGRASLSGIVDDADIIDSGNIQLVRWDADPQDLLRSLIDRTEVQHFEISRPSLHEIFVRIANPDAEAVARA